MTEEKKDLMKQEETALDTTRAPLGFDDADDRDDLIIPRAKLLQQMSPEIVDEVVDSLEEEEVTVVVGSGTETSAIIESRIYILQRLIELISQAVNTTIKSLSGLTMICCPPNPSA